MDTLTRQAARLQVLLTPGKVALITGPSGSGKTTLVNLVSRADRTITVKPLTHSQVRTSVAALSKRTPLAAWTSLLARFGLAESAILTARAADLSAGELARLELALAAARCERPTRRAAGHAALSVTGASNPGLHTGGPPTLLIDEWCSLLDRPTAVSVASSAARWARERQVRLIGATAHSDLAAAINADFTITLDDHGGVQWTGCGLSKAG